jgi:predicted porin
VAGVIPYDFSYYVLVETSPFINAGGYPYLLDAFLTYKRLGHWAKISVGSFKIPISQELNTPCNGLYTITRSKFVVDLTTPDRDLGIMVSGSSDSMNVFGMKTYNFLTYSLAYTNGYGVAGADNNRGKNFSGRVVLTPVPFFSFGGSFLMGNQKDENATTSNTDKRTRYGIDAEGRYKGLVVQAEYLYGKDDGSFTTGGGCSGPPVTYPGPIERAGYSIMAAYKFDNGLQPVVKYSGYDSDLGSSNNSVFDVYSTTTFGLNYYFNDWTRIQINYCINQEDLSPVDNDVISVQAQINFK